jgi:hypothetical protein
VSDDAAVSRSPMATASVASISGLDWRRRAETRRLVPVAVVVAGIVRQR